MRTCKPVAIIAMALIGLAACESTVVPTHVDETDPTSGVTVVPPGGEVTDETPGDDPGDITAVGPECRVDDDCVRDEGCDVHGGCDYDPCRDDRCVIGQCVSVDIPSCDPDYSLEYRYQACCAPRTLRIGPDGRCYFHVAGQPEQRCEDVSPAYLQRLVDHARGLGFFEWGLGHCVPGETSASFSLSLRAEPYNHAVSCTDGVCVGELCNILDGVWATLPSNWHDGCGCD